MIKLKPRNRNVPDQDLIDDLKRVAHKLGKDKVTIKEYNDRSNCAKCHSATFIRRFGSWLKALEKAGLKKTKKLYI